MAALQDHIESEPSEKSQNTLKFIKEEAYVLRGKQMVTQTQSKKEKQRERLQAVKRMQPCSAAKRGAAYYVLGFVVMVALGVVALQLYVQSRQKYLN